MEKESFIKDSKMAIKGAINGIVGSSLYEIIIFYIIAFIINGFVSANNAGADAETLAELVDKAYASFPYTILISCLASLVTFGVFIYIIKWENIKRIFKKMFSNNTIKWGSIIALGAITVSIMYNFIVSSLFDLQDIGNANQDNVISLIMSQPVLGFLSVVILAPIVEELTFRYCVFGGLYNKSKKVAYIVSSVIFMVMHSIASFMKIGAFNNELLMEFIFLPPYLISGILLCYAYDKTDNLGSSIIAHSLNNLVSFLSIVLL